MKTPQESSIWVWLCDFCFVQLSLPLNLKYSNIFCFNKQFLVFHLKTQSRVFSEAMCGIHLISQTLYVIHANNLSWVFKVGSWMFNQEENFILKPMTICKLGWKILSTSKKVRTHLFEWCFKGKTIPLERIDCAVPRKACWFNIKPEKAISIPTAWIQF